MRGRGGEGWGGLHLVPIFPGAHCIHELFTPLCRYFHERYFMKYLCPVNYFEVFTSVAPMLAT